MEEQQNEPIDELDVVDNINAEQQEEAIDNNENNNNEQPIDSQLNEIAQPMDIEAQEQIKLLTEELYQAKEEITNLEAEKEKKKQITLNKIIQLESDNKKLETHVNQLQHDASKNEELLDENSKLKEKLIALKQSVLQLKDRLDTDIYNKLELKTKLLKETTQINEQLEKKIELLSAEDLKNKSLEDQLRMYRDKFNEELKEKMNMQTFNNRQESTIKSLEVEIASLQDSLQQKEIKYNQLDKTYLSIIRVVEEQKKTIRNLQEKLLKRQTEEKTVKLQLYEKDQEIALLRSFITSLKNENTRVQQENVAKQIPKPKNDNKVKQVKIIHQKNEDNDLGNSKSFRIENSNSNKNFITVNDPEEDNLKEITSIMNKILNE